MHNEIVKQQFNKQADKFANWQVGRNIEYMQAYFEFCDLQPNDKILDVACGPGEFTLFLAQKVAEATGVDLSDKEIEIGNKLKHRFKVENLTFNCSDVENLPYPQNSFSVVLCKSAFHHYSNPEKVFSEMIRCCKENGKISIQDIVAYEDEYVNNYFEKLDKLIDISHNRTLNQLEFNTLYVKNNIKVVRDYRLNVDLNLDEYLEHAVQLEGNRQKLEEWIEVGKNDSKLSDYFIQKEDGWYFKRPVYLIIGRK